MNFSRIFKQIFVALLSFSLAILPLRTAQASPLTSIVWGAMSVAGVTFTAADLAGLATAIAGSGAIAYFNITAPDGSQIRVPSSASAVSIIPAPAASPTASTIAGGYIYPCCGYSGTGGGFTSFSDACSALASVQQSDHPGGNYIVTVVSSSYPICSLHYAGSDTNNNTIDWSSSDMGQTNAPPYCPDGYILSGSTCNLSDSRQSIFDNSQDFWRSSSSPAIAAYGGDKVGTITGVSGTKTNSGDSLTFTGTAACSGCSSSSDTFQGLVGGGTSVTQQTQRTDASGASYVQSTTVSVAPDGTIAGTATQNVTGSLGTVAAADGSLPIIPAAAGAIPATPTMAQQNTPPLVMPTDYNREATQTSIKANTDSLVTAATVSSSSALPPDTESADIANLIGVGNMPSFDRSGLSGTIALPASDDNSCQPMALTFMGRPWPWDICPMVNYLHPLVNYLFVFLFGLLCFRTAFNKEELS